MRGVNPEQISFRIRVCTGGSALTRLCPWFSGAVGVRPKPSTALYVRQSRLTVCTSGCPSTVQNPTPSGAR